MPSTTWKIFSTIHRFATKTGRASLLSAPGSHQAASENPGQDGGGLMRTRSGVYLYDLSAADASSPQARGLIRCKWFNAAYLEKNKVFRPGQRVFFYGKAEVDRYGTGNLQIIQPQFEILPESEPGGDSLEVGRVVPIYESMGRLSPRILRRLMRAAL